jgi:hypothetical protein
LPVDAITPAFSLRLMPLLLPAPPAALPRHFSYAAEAFRASELFAADAASERFQPPYAAITPFSPLILILLIFSPDTLSFSPLMPLFSLMIDTAISLSLLTLQRCCLLPIIFILLLLMPLPLLTPRH